MVNRNMNGVLDSISKIRDYDFYACAASAASDVELPEKFMLPIDDMCIVKDQGSIGACVSFALSTLKEYQHGVENGEHVIWSPGYIYGNPICRNGYNGYGMYITNALKGLMKVGFVEDTYFDILEEVPDIIDKVEPRSDLIERGSKYAIKNYTNLNYASESKKIDAIKRALYVYKLPIVIASRTYFSGGSHCILIYGWDDTKKKSASSPTQFAFRNSWGKGYKDNGNSFIPATYVNEAYSIFFNNFDLGFKDVSEDDWFYEEVKKGVFSGLIQGVSKTEFCPEASLIRGDMAIIVSRLLNKLKDSIDSYILTLNQKGIKASSITIKNTKDCKETFIDIEPGAYYSNEIKMVCANGIMTGIGEKLFGPKDHMTRAEMATTVVRIHKHIIDLLCDAIPSLNKDKLLSGATDIPQYADVADKSEWYYNYIYEASKFGLMNGVDANTFEPNREITRAEATTVLNREFRNIDKILETLEI